MTPVLVAIAGPSGSGKTTLARALLHRLGAEKVALLALDAYYRDLSPLSPEVRAVQNFDHPDALEWPLIREQLAALATGKSVALPHYDFSTHTRTAETENFEPRSFVLVEGLFALHDPEVRRLCSKHIYMAGGHDVCLKRRTDRDTRERGRTADSVREQYAATVKPMADQFILPTAAYAGLQLDGRDVANELMERALAYIIA